MADIDPNALVNLSKACVLVIESNQHAADMLAQMLRGFGVGEIQRALSIEEAENILKGRMVDLMIVEPKLRDGDACAFLRGIRRSKIQPLCYIPVILVSGHSTQSDVARGRDTGANFYIVKPIAPAVLLARIMWIASDRRAFVEYESYAGPDRRHKFEGPPVGSNGRRDSDLVDPLPDVASTNMSQSEIDSLVKPQRVLI